MTIVTLWPSFVPPIFKTPPASLILVSLGSVTVCTDVHWKSSENTSVMKVTHSTFNFLCFYFEGQKIISLNFPIRVDVNVALGGDATHLFSTTCIRAVGLMIMRTCPSGVAVAARRTITLRRDSHHVLTGERRHPPSPHPPTPPRPSLPPAP